ncbi:hypothetical protein LINPERPRIM_LOCUS40440 [Linum perenne]
MNHFHIFFVDASIASASPWTQGGEQVDETSGDSLWAPMMTRRCS